MKVLLAALVATTALSAAVPASSQNYYGRDQRDYGRGQNDWERGSSYRLSQRFDHAYRGIQHGLEDGSFTRWEAQGFFEHVRELRRRLAYYQRGGRLNGWERQDLDRRLQRLHDVTHAAHEDGHDAQRDYGDDDDDDHDHDRR